MTRTPPDLVPNSHRVTKPSIWIINTAKALIVASLLVPALVFALAAWQSRRVALREAETRVERTVRILQEHAIKVFETQKLIIDEVNGRLPSVD